MADRTVFDLFPIDIAENLRLTTRAIELLSPVTLGSVTPLPEGAEPQNCILARMPGPWPLANIEAVMLRTTIARMEQREARGQLTGDYFVHAGTYSLDGEPCSFLIVAPRETKH